jgi:hypothetical protein
MQLQVAGAGATSSISRETADPDRWINLVTNCNTTASYTILRNAHLKVYLTCFLDPLLVHRPKRYSLYTPLSLPSHMLSILPIEQAHCLRSKRKPRDGAGSN